MNKLIAIALCCTLSLATLTPTVSFAQSSSTKMSKHPDGSVKMKDGKMMVMKGGAWAPMASDMTMTDGSKVMKDGTWVKKDGTKTMLTNGQSVDADGTFNKGKAQ